MASSEYAKQYERETYAWLKSHGICVRCRHHDAVKGQVRCPECAAKERDRMRNYKVDPVKHREYMRVYMRAYRRAGRDVRGDYEIDRS
jgi:hypothetical protein